MFNNIRENIAKVSYKLSRLAGDEDISSSYKQREILPQFDVKFLWQLLPYDQYDPETRIFFNKKSQGFILETTPLTGSSEETENILTSIITDSLPVDADLQFILWASPKIQNHLDAFVQQRSSNETFAFLAKKRAEYLKKGAHQSITNYGSMLLRDIRTFIVISIPKRIEDMTAELIIIRDNVINSLKSINIGTQVFSAQDFINTWFDIINPNLSTQSYNARWNELDNLSEQLHDANSQMNVNPKSLRFTCNDVHNEDNPDDYEKNISVIALNVKDYPQHAALWQVGENLGQLFNSTLQIPCPFLISFNIKKLSTDKAWAQAQINASNKEKTAKSPLAKFKPSVNKEYEDWQYIRGRISQGDTLVKTFYQVLLFCEPSKARMCERRVTDLYRANGWKLINENYLQLQSFLSTLPFMFTEGMYSDVKIFGRLKTMTAFNAVNVAPIQGEWKGTKTPSLLLPSRRGQLSFWSSFDNEDGNYNIAILAAPGKGKSVLVQEIIMATLGAKGLVQVIDQGHSQQKTCNFLGGQFIEFTNDRPICLNPYTNITDIDDAIAMLKPMLASMARTTSNATDEELAYLEKAIKGAYAWEGNDATITTVSKWLKETKNDICKNLSHLLYSYTSEGSYSKFFEGKCSIDFSNPFVVLELQELKSKKELRKIVLQLLIYQISQRMYQSGRTQVKSCIIDEAWDLFDDDNITAAKFIEAGYRTARKFGGNFISIAHSVADFHKNPMSKAAFDCSDFKIILGQTDEAINKLKQEKIMDIDGYVERMLKSLKVTKDFSECVIKSPEGLSLHRIILDPFSRILYSTKGYEFDAVNNLVSQGMNLMDAVDHVARKFYG